MRNVRSKYLEQKTIKSEETKFEQIINEASLTAGVDLLSIVKASVTGSLTLEDDSKVKLNF